MRGRLATRSCTRETQTIPIVFADVTDPVANGIVPRFQRATTTIPIVFSVGNDSVKATRRHSACYTPRPGAPLAKLLFRRVSR